MRCHNTSALDKQFGGLVQKRRKSTANALELRLSCTNPYQYTLISVHQPPPPPKKSYICPESVSKPEISQNLVVL